MAVGETSAPTASTDDRFELHSQLLEDSKRLLILTGNMMKTGAFRHHLPTSTSQPVLARALRDALCRGSYYGINSQEECHRFKRECADVFSDASPKRLAVKRDTNGAKPVALPRPSVWLATRESENGTLDGKGLEDFLPRGTPSPSSFLEISSYSAFQHPGSDNLFMDSQLDGLDYSAPSVSQQRGSLYPLVVVIDSKYQEQVIASERMRISVTGKLFLPVAKLEALVREDAQETDENLKKFIEKAFDTLCLFLNVSYVDALVICIYKEDPGQQPPSQQSLQTCDCPNGGSMACAFEDGFLTDRLAWLMKLWPIFESMKAEGKICGLSTSDLDFCEFRRFCDFIDAAKGRSEAAAWTYPMQNQIFVPSSCAELPHKLLQFAKSKNTEITGHKDPPALLSSDLFRSLLLQLGSAPVLQDYRIDWGLRYAYFIPSQSVMSNFAYVAALSKP